MQCSRVTVVRAVRCATDHGLSLFSDGFPYIFTATPSGRRGHPAFNLPWRLITFIAKPGTADCGSLYRRASRVQPPTTALIRESLAALRSAVGGPPCHDSGLEPRPCAGDGARTAQKLSQIPSCGGIPIQSGSRPAVYHGRDGLATSFEIVAYCCKWSPRFRPNMGPRR